jgi:hypothetical protein
VEVDAVNVLPYWLASKTLNINISFSSFQLDEEFPVIFLIRGAGEPRQLFDFTPFFNIQYLAPL